MVGDPGCGKSTLLNALCGNVSFEAGLSRGSGLTKALDSKVINGKRYSDTPGLDDTKHRKAAAVAIQNAVQWGGNVKLIFVITVEAGRIRASNLATMRIVLKALLAAGVVVDRRFSVLINKMSAGELRLWGNPLTTGARVFRDQVECVYQPDQLFYVPEDKRLKDIKNGEFPAEHKNVLVTAISKMRVMGVKPGLHIDVSVEDFRAKVEQMEEELAELRAKNGSKWESFKNLAKGAGNVADDAVKVAGDVVGGLALGAAAAGAILLVPFGL